MKNHIFCYNCGLENSRLRFRCKNCHKWLRPLDKNAKSFTKDIAKDQIKDKVTEKFFDRLTLFIQKHAFGLLFSCTLIAGVLPNLIALARSDEPIQTVTSAPVFLTEEQEEAREEEPEAPAPEEPKEKPTETPAETPAEELESPAAEEELPTPATTSYSSFNDVLSSYFVSQSSVPTASDFNALNNTSFTSAERSSLLAAGVVPLFAGSFTMASNSWVTIRPVNNERSSTSTVYNALDLSRYQIGDYATVGRAEYLLEVYACRTAPCTPPSGAWSLSNVREISYYYLMLISLTNPKTSDTVYYHLITSTNLPTTYASSQYFYASVYAPDDDPSVVYNFSQWFARDWYPYDYTRGT